MKGIIPIQEMPTKPQFSKHSSFQNKLDQIQNNDNNKLKPKNQATTQTKTISDEQKSLHRSHVQAKECS